MPLRCFFILLNVYFSPPMDEMDLLIIISLYILFSYLFIVVISIVFSIALFDDVIIILLLFIIDLYHSMVLI